MPGAFIVTRVVLSIFFEDQLCIAVNVRTHVFNRRCPPVGANVFVDRVGRPHSDVHVALLMPDQVRLINLPLPLGQWWRLFAISPLGHLHADVQRHGA